MKQLARDGSRRLKWFNGISLAIFALGLILMPVMGSKAGTDSHGWFYPLAVLLLAYAVVVYFLYELPCADVVTDLGDSILVARGGMEERFRLADLRRVEASRFGQQRRMALHIRRDNSFGDRVHFKPSRVFGGGDVDEFNRRIEQARGSE